MPAHDYAILFLSIILSHKNAPAQPNNVKTKRYCVLLDENETKEARILALLENKSFSIILRNMIRDYIEKKNAELMLKKNQF